MSDKVKVAEAEQVAEQVWHKTAVLGVPSTVYRKDLAPVKIAELPISEELAAVTLAKNVGEFFETVRTQLNTPEAILLNAKPVDASVEPIGSGIQRRMQWLTSSLDMLTGRYRVMTATHHEVLFDPNLAIASGVKMTFHNGRWTAWDWYKSLGWQSQGRTPIPQIKLNKHNSITALLAGQRITIPFGRDRGDLMGWFEEILEMTLSEWVNNRDEAFQKLKEMQDVFFASQDKMYRHQHGIKSQSIKLDEGIYEITSPTGQFMGERTYNPSKDSVVDSFNIMAANGYTFKKVA